MQRTRGNSRTKAAVGAALAAALALTGAPALAATTDAAGSGAEAGTWFESAYATWSGSDDGYRVYVRAQEAFDWRDDSRISGWLAEWDEVDSQLVRVIDEARGTWRVDVPGLPRGTYDIEVRDGDGAVVHAFDGLQTSSYPRNGAAFVPSDEDVYGFPGTNGAAPEGVTGGYLADGRIDPDAELVYLTAETMGDFDAAVFAEGRGDAREGDEPLVVRVIGTVGSFDEVAATKAEAGAEVPAGVGDGRMMSIGAGNGDVTIEGIGPDATVYGWGFTTAGASNVEFRNLSFDQWLDDAVYLNGGGSGTRASNLWVHNNTFGYGQNKHLALGQDPDQAKGDGAVDVSNHARNYTVDYNRFDGSSKAMLIGGGTGSISQHYGTIHHNWFHGSEERTPRVRNGRVHVFNNLYQDIQGHPFHNQLLERNTGYGIGAAHNATVWAEGNIFDDVNYPFLRSRQGHARGSQVIDYEPGPGESADANAGFNHFFGDAPGFIVSQESVAQGDFPESVAGFRSADDVEAGITEEDLDSLREAAGALQPNVLDEASAANFDPTLDVGVVVADGSTTTNPTMKTDPLAQLDWAFRPAEGGVWSTGTPDEAAALRAEIEERAGAIRRDVPQQTPSAPRITGVEINDERRSATSEFIPEPGRIVVHEGTFTIDWAGEDPLAEAYEVEWDRGEGEWTPIATIAASARPTTLLTETMNQFALPESVEIQAEADDPDAQFLFRVRAVNPAGASPWSETYALNGELVRATPAATVERRSGATNQLTVTVDEEYSDGLVLEESAVFDVRNNADGAYRVGSRLVHVDTYGGTKVRDVRFVD
ncbi:pectate lyase family protein [Microbacterium halophytorum]|uniref:pectate lyase family protein n=1 Tax=Microbacterium halophytorum TaxID=2067568 RepID=UPI000CFD347B|nr:hypothetical protein [Microbacterium halophytorum]